MDKPFSMTPSIKISIQLYDKKLKYNSQAPIICNFRKNDILNGGSGAPIIPIYHQIIANKLNTDNSIFINIGGVTNITLIENNKIIAGDSSYGNALINDILSLKTNHDFDLNGNLSKSGKIIDSLSKKILNDKYFKKKFPKSLDRNYFHQYLKDVKDDFLIEDVIYTLLSVIPESVIVLLIIKKNIK
jgi:anhydro-N-acetylmuramic acid kinase